MLGDCCKWQKSAKINTWSMICLQNKTTTKSRAANTHVVYKTTINIKTQTPTTTKQNKILRVTFLRSKQKQKWKWTNIEMLNFDLKNTILLLTAFYFLKLRKNLFFVSHFYYWYHYYQRNYYYSSVYNLVTSSLTLPLCPHVNVK